MYLMTTSIYFKRKSRRAFCSFVIPCLCQCRNIGRCQAFGTDTSNHYFAPPAKHYALIAFAYLALQVWNKTNVSGGFWRGGHCI